MLLMLIQQGQKLRSGELDTKMIKFTYGIEDDPSVGVSLWAASDKDEFDRLFAPHAKYYEEIIEISSVVKPAEAMVLIMQKMN